MMSPYFLPGVGRVCPPATGATGALRQPLEDLTSSDIPTLAASGVFRCELPPVIAIANGVVAFFVVRTRFILGSPEAYSFGKATERKRTCGC